MLAHYIFWYLHSHVSIASDNIPEEQAGWTLLPLTNQDITSKRLAWQKSHLQSMLELWLDPGSADALLPDPPTATVPPFFHVPSSQAITSDTNPHHRHQHGSTPFNKQLISLIYIWIVWHHLEVDQHSKHFIWMVLPVLFYEVHVVNCLVQIFYNLANF